MGIRTKIEYCDSTINPTPCCSGCELYSPDTTENHCYAATLVNRYKGLKGWPDSFTEFKLFEHRIPQACGWPDLAGQVRPDKPWLNSYPRIIFINDLGDGFAPIAPWNWAEPYIGMMETSPHIWLWLSKWPSTMVQFFEHLGHVPPNFWLGTTVTSHKTSWRIRELLKLRKKATILWISLEPLLGPINFDVGSYGMFAFWFDKLDLICSGGESGLNARPSLPDWHRGARDFCQERGIKYFFKQWGEWEHSSQCVGSHTQALLDGWTYYWDDDTYSVRVGKKRAGRLLDGREWSEMP